MRTARRYPGGRLFWEFSGLGLQPHKLPPLPIFYRTKCLSTSIKYIVYIQFFCSSVGMIFQSSVSASICIPLRTHSGFHLSISLIFSSVLLIFPSPPKKHGGITSNSSAAWFLYLRLCYSNSCGTNTPTKHLQPSQDLCCPRR
jgi:hypothetical protein